MYMIVVKIATLFRCHLLAPMERRVVWEFESSIPFLLWKDLGKFEFRKLYRSVWCFMHSHVTWTISSWNTDCSVRTLSSPGQLVCTISARWCTCCFWTICCSKHCALLKGVYSAADYATNPKVLPPPMCEDIKRPHKYTLLKDIDRLF